MGRGHGWAWHEHASHGWVAHDPGPRAWQSRGWGSRSAGFEPGHPWARGPASAAGMPYGGHPMAGTQVADPTLGAARNLDGDDPVRRSDAACVPPSSEFSPVEREFPMNQVKLRHAALTVASHADHRPRVWAGRPAGVAAADGPQPAIAPSVVIPRAVTPVPTGPILGGPGHQRPCRRRLKRRPIGRIAALRANSTSPRRRPSRGMHLPRQCATMRRAPMPCSVNVPRVLAAKLSALDNMKSYAQVAHACADNTEALATAFEGLYAAWSAISKTDDRYVVRERGNKNRGAANQALTPMPACMNDRVVSCDYSSHGSTGQGHAGDSASRCKGQLIGCRR